MTNWLPLSLADLNDYLVGAQVTALNTAALAAGQSDRFTKIMTDMVNRIRVKIEGCPRNHISATPLTIPPELKWVACYVIIEAMQAAVPGLKLTDDQRNQIAKASDQLTRIADGKEVVSKPTDPLLPVDVQRGGETQLLSHSPSHRHPPPNPQSVITTAMKYFIAKPLTPSARQFFSLAPIGGEGRGEGARCEHS